MESPVQPTKWSENLLFVFLGALSAVILSLGTFGGSDARDPASQEQTLEPSSRPLPVTNSDLDPRVFISID